MALTSLSQYAHRSLFLAVYGKLLDEAYLGKNGGDLGGDVATSWILPFSGGRWVRYQQTKLANVVFSYALHDRLTRAAGADKKVKALVAHPGLSATNLQATTASDSRSPSVPGGE